MASQADERMMVSERIAPGMLPRVLSSTDMTIIFLAIVLFIVQASVIQPAGPSAYVYWVLGFLLFLIPGAIVTAQLGQMFPQEGSLYVWTQKALGPFWGFFAGFCAWWPGVLVGELKRQCAQHQLLFAPDPTSESSPRTSCAPPSPGALERRRSSSQPAPRVRHPCSLPSTSSTTSCTWC